MYEAASAHSEERGHTNVGSEKLLKIFLISVGIPVGRQPV
jgi:hypothetical protein